MIWEILIYIYGIWCDFKPCIEREIAFIYQSEFNKLPRRTHTANGQCLISVTMKKIILVEDNPDNAELVVDILEDEYDITTFVSGSDLLSAFEKAGAHTPDLFILDIGLPGMDGVSLLKELKSIASIRNVPALALTAHAMKEDEPRLLQAGFNGYVSKPIVDEAAFTDEIEKLIGAN